MLAEPSLFRCSKQEVAVLIAAHSVGLVSLLRLYYWVRYLICGCNKSTLSEINQKERLQRQEELLEQLEVAQEC
jgi:hypothetical protein